MPEGGGLRWLAVLWIALFSFSGIAQPSLKISSQSPNAARISWEDSSGAFVFERSPRLGAAADWQVVGGVSVQGAVRSIDVVVGSQTEFFRLHSDGFTTVETVSPLLDEIGVAVTRETIFSLTAPLAPETSLGVADVYAEFGGRRILSRVELSSDRRTVTLFYQENLPASAQINVFFDGEGIRDANGTLIDADGDGQAGGIFATHFTTLGNTPLDNTGVIGHVYAAEKGGGGTNIPLQGVTITVDGAEETLRAVTDAQGFFRLQPAPVGRFFVHIDGRTLIDLPAGIRYPDLAYYPFVGKAWEAAAGSSNNLAGGTGEIFLPLIQADALKPVSAVAATSISFASSVIATNPAFADVSITVPANALFSDNGTRGGKVGIAPVPPDRLPGPLPPGLELPIVITVQTDGPLNFDQPAPICFPNVVDPVLKTPLPPGTKQALISFNHDKGEWEAVGTMTVSADGKLICSDPGSGIRQPGWHGSGPPPQPGPPPPNPPPPPPPPDPPPPPPDPPPDPCEEKGRPGGDPECGCEKSGPNAVELAICFEEVGAQERECRAAVAVTYNELVQNCYQNFKDGLMDYTTYQQCLTDAKNYRIGALKKCANRAQEMRSQCNKCAGAPNPGPPPRETGRLQATAVDKPQAIIAKQDQLDAVIGAVPPLPQAQFVQQVETLLGEIAALAGGQIRTVLIDSIIADQRAAAALPPPAFIQLGNAPPHPIKYAAEIFRPSGTLYVRGETLPYAQYSIFVPRDGFLMRVMFFDPVSKRYGEVLPDRRPEAPYPLPRLFLPKIDPSQVEDGDIDGLPDIVELILGTNASHPDSDGDGLIDGLEVRDSTNPLDGLPAQIGVIASVKTQGSAVDVVAFDGFAALAEGAAGVSIFDVSNFSRPVRAVQIDTPGSAGAVAVSGNYLAVADGTAGLAIVDISQPASAFLRAQVQLPGDAVSVTAQNGIAFVGLRNGTVSRIDLASGQLLQSLVLGNGRISDLLADGNALFAYENLILHAISLEDDGMTKTGQFSVPGILGAGSVRFRVSGGDGLIYAVHARGFAVVEWRDISGPAKLVANHTTTQVGWKQIVPNSGGIGVAAVGLNSTTDGPHDVYLHDLRPDGTNSVFLSALPTPGYAGAVALNGRLAYVADGAAGLQIVNYLPSDLAGNPPSISLAADFSLNPPRAESGQFARVTGIATDDILVANVEFYLDGQLARRDETYPFTFEFYAPGLTAQKTNFVLRARARDTAGNESWTAPIDVAILADATPPKVSHLFPVHGAVLATVDRAVARFSEAMNPADFTLANMVLRSAGPDLDWGTADDSILPASAVYVASLASAQIDFPGGLANGLYRLEVQNVRDASGLVLASPVSSEFFVAPGGPDGDPDGDGLPNSEESAAQTNPFVADTDGDGWVDEVEVHDGKNPRDPSSRPEQRFVARPSVEAQIRLAEEDAPFGPWVARPSVDVIARDGAEDAPAGPTVASPSVNVSIDLAEVVAPFGPWVARPTVDVSLDDASENAPLGPIVARPAVEVNFVHPLENDPAGPTVARPPAAVKINP